MALANCARILVRGWEARGQSPYFVGG